MLIFWIIFCVVIVMGVFMLLIFAPDFVFTSAVTNDQAHEGTVAKPQAGLNRTCSHTN